ncbi:MAG: TrpB-like pyridoxal phosphate-dependent enzyme, partial [Gaiellales bacterium]
PSDRTSAGRAVLEADPESPGSLGIAISEAVEVAASSGGRVKYSLGSVLNHVLMHQTVIGLEAQRQFELADAYPDVVIGCAGGGSNFAGFAFPFVRDRLVEGTSTRIVAVEPTACPTLTGGKYVYDFGDTAMTTPLIKMYTLGHSFIPAPVHAGGLRYHGMAPLVCALYEQGLIEAVALPQNAVFEAALSFAASEGILPAPEAAHAVKVAIDEAVACREAGEQRTIALNLSGHGHFDMSAYDAYLAGRLPDYEYPQAEAERALAELPAVDVPG